MRQPVRLNLGSGNAELDGWTNLDIAKGVDVRALPYLDESVDVLRASHVLEHVPRRDAEATVKEWARVLRQEGRIWIAVPDFEKVARHYIDGVKDPMTAGYVVGGQTDEHDLHRMIYDEALLRDLLDEAGFVDIEPWDASREPDCAAHPISLALTARKPRWTEVPLKRKACMVMSVPRFGLTDNAFCVAMAAATHGLLLMRCGGVFWEQGMSDMFEELVDQYRYLIAIDYDTVFSPDDLTELSQFMDLRPEVDALAPVQAARGRDHVLMCQQRTDGKLTQSVPTEKVLSSPIMPVATAHFGCTFIRTSALKRVPKPWFQGVPGEGGSWKAPHIDPDIWFWVRWRDAGNTLYQCNAVPVGHIQEMVTWPDAQFRPITQYLQDYREHGKPAETMQVRNGGER